MKKMLADIVAISHKSPKVNLFDVITGFCRGPKFFDGHTETYCQFLTQLKLRKWSCSIRLQDSLFKSIIL